LIRVRAISPKDLRRRTPTLRRWFGHCVRGLQTQGGGAMGETLWVAKKTCSLRKQVRIYICIGNKVRHYGKNVALIHLGGLNVLQKEECKKGTTGIQWAVQKRKTMGDKLKRQKWVSRKFSNLLTGSTEVRTRRTHRCNYRQRTAKKITRLKGEAARYAGDKGDGRSQRQKGGKRSLVIERFPS